MIEAPPGLDLKPVRLLFHSDCFQVQLSKSWCNIQSFDGYESHENRSPSRFTHLRNLSKLWSPAKIERIIS